MKYEIQYQHPKYPHTFMVVVPKAHIRHCIRWIRGQGMRATKMNLLKWGK